MGIVERKERQKAELREQILDAARAIVLAEGFDALSMRKIADAIEYSPATIYLHFASREELALQLVREGFLELMNAIAPALAIRDPLERLRDMGRRYVRFGLESPQTYRLIFMEDPAFSDEVIGRSDDDSQEPGERAFATLEAAVAECIAAGYFGPMEPQLGADLIWAAFHGIVSLRIACPEGKALLVDVDTLTESMLATLERGMRP
jgi:AcrR family transcriptional regulator